MALVVLFLIAVILQILQTEVRASMADFNRAVEHLLDIEQGYVNDPDDPGGETKYGISKRSYPDVDIKNLTPEHAKRIYFRDWWEPLSLTEVFNQELASQIFKFAVNAGIHRAVIVLQTSINEVFGLPTVVVDGIFGPQTRHAMLEVQSGLLETYLCAFFKLGIIQYYASLKKKKYIFGWLKRVFS